MISERLMVLQDAGIIEPAAAEFAGRTESRLTDRFPDDREAVNVFVTHLAMATQRIINGESVEEIDEGIWNEVSCSPQRDPAMRLLEEIRQDAPCQIPESECRFLVIHLCNILNS